VDGSKKRGIYYTGADVLQRSDEGVLTDSGLPGACRAGWRKGTCRSPAAWATVLKKTEGGGTKQRRGGNFPLTAGRARWQRGLGKYGKGGKTC